jgi:hypothetical protein
MYLLTICFIRFHEAYAQPFVSCIQFYIFPSECSDVFCAILTINSRYFLNGANRLVFVIEVLYSLTTTESECIVLFKCATCIEG